MRPALLVALFAPLALPAPARADRYARGQLLYQEMCVRCHTVGWKLPGTAEPNAQGNVDLTRIIDKRGDDQLRSWMSDPARERDKSSCRHGALGREQIDDLIHFLHARAGAAPEKPRPAARTSHEQELQFELILADGSLYAHKGKFYFAGREVNVTTGTLQITGLFPNPEHTLRPGQFARVRARTSIRSGAIAVPQRAVSELQGSYQVTLVDADNKVHIQPVRIGERTGTMWIIEEGVQPGQRVVVEGIQRVKEGMLVHTTNAPPESLASAASK